MAVCSQRRARCARLAPLALMPAGALAVHELRYWLAFGSHASAALARQGHAYLHSLVPWILLGLGLALGAFARAVGRAWAGERSPARYSLSLLGLWLLCTASLLFIYAAQETLEGVLASGHSAGWVGIVGDGGWWALPACACVGLVLAAAYHGARWVLRTVAAGAARRRARRPRPAPARPACSRARPRPVAWRGGWSLRGPPPLPAPLPPR